jgi:hypothetical protein
MGPVGESAESAWMVEVKLQGRGSLSHRSDGGPSLPLLRLRVGPCYCKWVSSTADHGPTVSGTPIPVMLAST